jgi:hypothetical protein
MRPRRGSTPRLTVSRNVTLTLTLTLTWKIYGADALPHSVSLTGLYAYSSSLLIAYKERILYVALI